MVVQLTPDLVQHALEAAPDAMVIVDAAGTILFANQQVERVFDYPRAELVGKSVECLLPERYRTHHVGHRQQFGADGRFRPMGAGLELYARRRDGTEFPVEISLSPIAAGRSLVAAAIRDVTDRKRVQSELVAAREAADRANQAKSRFLATASHDLRQPVQALALLNGALRRMTDDPDLTEALVRQDQAIDAMSRLLNALLDISKLESGAIRPEPTDFTVAALLEELRAEFAGLAANKGLELKVEPCAECVHCDRSLVEQILRNLVSNAIKYTRQGAVRLRCLHESAAVRIQVLDTGIGMASSELPYIYDEFYQVGVPANSVREGFGLGLSIVHRLVKLLGLQLQVQSEVGKGSVFTLDLPPSSGRRDQQPAPSPRRAGAASAQSLQRPHILLVEDDPAVLAATRMLLKVDGYRVTTASSLAEAEQRARENPDIRALVSDYHLGAEQTGTQVITSLRHMLDPKLKAILVTGDTSRAIRELPADEGVRVISKPVNVDELLALLRALTAA